MRLRVYEGAALPERVESAWEKACRAASTRVTPFLWPRATLTAACVVPDTFVAVVFDAEEPVAFLPLERRGRRGLPVAFAVTDGDGIVCQPGLDVPMHAVARACGLRSIEWTHRLVTDDPLAPFDHLRLPAARIDLSGGFQAYRERPEVSDGAFREAARKRRKLEREVGEVTFDPLGSHDLAPQILRWKAEQLRRGGEATDLDDGNAAALLAAFGAQWTGPDHRSWCSVLRAGKEIVALNWGLSAGGLLVSSIPTHDERFARYSPGLLLHTELIQHAAALGIEEVDLGLHINQTKDRLMTHVVELAAGAVYASAHGRAYRRARTVVRRAIRGF